MTDSGLQTTLGLPLRLLQNNLVIKVQKKATGESWSVADLPQGT